MENDELILLELKDIKEDVRGIQSCLNGNGKPGLCTRMAAVEAMTGTIKRIMWLIIGGILTVVTSAFAASIFHIKIGG
jgi:hypothetical protein